MESEVLSGSPPRRANFRRPSGLLGMVFLVVLIEAAFSSRRAEFVTPWADDWRLTSEAARSKATTADVLCFGDSLVKYGVMPKVVEARSGLKAYNLATSGGTMASSYFLLRQAIEAGARPKAVMVDVVALMLLEDVPPKPLNYAELGTWRDCIDLGWTAGDGDFLGQLLAAKLLPSYRWRFEIRRATLAALEGQSNPSKRSELASFRTLWNRENGAQPSPASRVFHPQEDFLIDGVSPEKWACDPKDRTYAERFLSLAEAHQIDVYWLIPPMSPGVHARRAVRGTDARYDRFVRTIVSKHPKTVLLDARPSGYDDTVHLDHLHLNRQGAMVLSADLADVMVEGLNPRGSTRPPNPRIMPALAGRTGTEPTSSIAHSRTSAPAQGTVR